MKSLQSVTDRYLLAACHHLQDNNSTVYLQAAIFQMWTCFWHNRLLATRRTLYLEATLYMFGSACGTLTPLPLPSMQCSRFSHLPGFLLSQGVKVFQASWPNTQRGWISLQAPFGRGSTHGHCPVCCIVSSFVTAGLKRSLPYPCMTLPTPPALWGNAGHRHRTELTATCNLISTHTQPPRRDHFCKFPNCKIRTLAP